MGETTDEIESHIERTRQDLESNLRELEQKVKSATDWRHQFRNHTQTMIAAAFAGGMLAATIFGKLRFRRQRHRAFSARRK